MRSLAAEAKTPEELESVRKLAKELLAIDDTAPNVEHVGKWVVKTLAEVGEFFGVATQTVKQWRTDQTPMPGEEGVWNLQAIAKWRHERATASTVRHAKSQQELERGQIRLEKEKLELQMMQGQMLDRAEVEEWASIVLSEARELVMQIPGAVSSMCHPNDRDSVLAQADELARHVLESLHERLSERAETGGPAAN